MNKVINITPKEIAKALYDVLDKIEELEDKYENAVADYEYEKCKNNQAIEYIKTHSEMTDLQICGIENVLSFRGSTTKLLEILGDKENE